MARNDGRIEKGQRLSTAISAKAWNRAQQAADIVLGAQPSAEAGSTSFGSSPYIWVYAKNTTGSDVARWGVMAITGVQITPSGSNVAEFERMPVLTGAAISGNEGKERCVAVEPIANNAVGRVAVSGAVQIKAADIEKVPSALVLWKDSGWAFVQLGGGGPRLGTISATWNKGSAATVTLQRGNGATITPTETFTATNYFSRVFVESGATKRVLCVKIGENWLLVAAECSS